MPKMISTVRGREFGNGLRAAITQSGMSPREIAAELGCHESKISNLVNGKGGADQTELALLLGLCRPDVSERQHLQSLFAGADRNGWWQQHGKCSPISNRTFSENIVAAKTLVSWHTHMIPDGLQTASYARAVLRASPTVPPEELEARLQAHMKKQNQLLHHRRLSCTFYLPEVALRRRLDDTEMHIEQVRHVLQLATRPRITVRLVPETRGAHAGLRGPFMYLDFDKYEPLVWLENENSSLILENADAVAGYETIIKSLNAASLDETESTAATKELLRAIEEPGS